MDAVLEITKVYGPLGIGWIIACYLMKFIIDRYDSDIKSRTELAMALNQLATTIKEIAR